jgi:hypothetical protein
MRQQRTTEAQDAPAAAKPSWPGRPVLWWSAWAWNRDDHIGFGQNDYPPREEPQPHRGHHWKRRKDVHHDARSDDGDGGNNADKGQTRCRSAAAPHRTPMKQIPSAGRTQSISPMSPGRWPLRTAAAGSRLHWWPPPASASSACCLRFVALGLPSAIPTLPLISRTQREIEMRDGAGQGEFFGRERRLGERWRGGGDKASPAGELEPTWDARRLSNSSTVHRFDYSSTKIEKKRRKEGHCSSCEFLQWKHDVLVSGWLKTSINSDPKLWERRWFKKLTES